MVNQVETHVFCQQRDARRFMDKYRVQIMSWGPFAEGRNNYFTNPVLKKIGEAHGKTVGQTALRFLYQEGIVLIPKSVHKVRMIENFSIFDFELTGSEMNEIRALDTGKSLFFDHETGDTAEMFMGWVK